MESRRLLLATILSIAVVILYQVYQARFAPPPAPRPAPSPSPAAAPTATAGAAPGHVPEAQAPGAAGSPASQAAAASPPPATPAGQSVPVKTEHYELRFTTAGGVLTEARLVDYRASREAGAPPVAVADVPGGALGAVTLAAGGQGQPLLPPGTLFKAEPSSGLTLAPGQQGALTFTAEGPNGVRVTNRYLFDGRDFAFRLEQTVSNAGKAPVAVQQVWLLRHARDEAAEQATGFLAGALARRAGEVRRVDFPDLAQPERIAGPVDWAGWQEKYFAAVVLPKGPPVESVLVSQQSAEQTSETAARPLGQVQLLLPAATVAPGATAGAQAQVYLGPKDVGALRAVDPTLEQVIHFGFFHWIAMPLLLLLRWFHDLVGNYGLAIITLTILVKIVFWPLTAKQIKSSKAMAKVQPEIAKIREKFKDDREALNRETMELFRRHNVNPLMGCLPLLVQIPVFFALYQVLNGAIELRHAPFFGWIQDLSAMDPYYVTPVLMGVTMFVTQKMTPTPGMDPVQQKIMLLMPAMMSVFFLWMPSGLVLYWLVMNVLQIGQQMYANRLPA